MLYKLKEIVIEYNPSDYDDWVSGKKSKLLEDRSVPQDVYNQPRYHFGEYFVLYYFKKARWHGFNFFSFSEPSQEKHIRGYKKIAELFPSDLLKDFQSVRSQKKGKPDLSYIWITGQNCS